MRLFAILACALPLAMATACAGSAPRAAMSDELAPLVERALADAALRAQGGRSSMQVISAEAVTWPDGSLGCPAPGGMYTMAQVPGYRIRIQAGPEVLDYHANRRGQLQLCPAGRAVEPRKDELK